MPVTSRMSSTIWKRTPSSSAKRAVGNCRSFAHVRPRTRATRDARGDQPPGLELVQARAARRRRGPASVTSTYWPPTIPSTPVARGELARAQRRRVRRALLALGEEPDRLGEEPVAGEDRHVLAVLDVRGRPPAAQLVVVHRGQVVVDQRVGVDQLDRGGGGQHRSGVGPIARAVASASTGRIRLPPASSE